MIEPKIEELIEAADSKYTLVLLAAKRGRQITAYFNQLGEGVSEYAAPMVDTAFSERAPKALSVALDEIAAGKVSYERTADGIK